MTIHDDDGVAGLPSEPAGGPSTAGLPSPVAVAPAAAAYELAPSHAPLADASRFSHLYDHNTFVPLSDKTGTNSHFLKFDILSYSKSTVIALHFGI